MLHYRAHIFRFPNSGFTLTVAVKSKPTEWKFNNSEAQLTVHTEQFVLGFYETRIFFFSNA